MSGIARVRAQKLQEREENRHSRELKQLKQKNYSQFLKTKKTKESQLEQMTKKYDSDVLFLEAKHKKNLMKIRGHFNQISNEEEKRLGNEVKELREAHSARVDELKSSQINEVENLEKSHNDIILNMRDKFRREKMRYES